MGWGVQKNSISPSVVMVLNCVQIPQRSSRDLLSVDRLLLIKETLSEYLCALQGPFTFMADLKVMFQLNFL